MAGGSDKRTSPTRRFRSVPRAGAAGTGSPSGQNGTVRLVLGFMGWFAAVGVFSLLLLIGGRHAVARRALDSDFLRRVEQSRERLRRRETEVRDRREALTREINARIEEQEEHGRAVRDLQRALTAAGPAAADEATPAGLAPRDEAPDEAAREELARQLAELEGRLADARREYEGRFARMKEEFDAKRAHPEPGMLRQWYAGHEHTVFAPAAAYLIGEDLYSRKRSREAARFYTEILERYPDSSYRKRAEERLVRIRTRKPFTPVPFTFEPYFPVGETP